MNHKHYKYSVCLDGYWFQCRKTIPNDEVDWSKRCRNCKEFYTLKKLEQWLRYVETFLAQPTQVEVFDETRRLQYFFKVGGRENVDN